MYNMLEPGSPPPLFFVSVLLLFKFNKVLKHCSEILVHVDMMPSDSVVSDCCGTSCVRLSVPPP